MRPRRAARRLLDPWAGLLFAALIVLGVVILLATPAPWRMVGGPQAPVTLASAPPSDIAAFVFAGPASARCTAVVWLHVEHEPAEVTVVMVPPQSRCAVPGGGYAPIRRLATDLGPKTASVALGDALGVSFDGWTTLDRAAVGRLLAATRAPGDGREGMLDLTTAAAALGTAPRDLDGLRRQHDALARCLRVVLYDELSANAIVNYVLGSDDVDTDLDLRAVSAVVRTFGALTARSVAVRTAAAIVETCGAARWWRLDESRLGPLRLSLALGLRAPAAVPRVTTRAMAAEVLVAAPPGLDAGRFAAALRAELIRGGARPVDVSAVSVSGEAAGQRLAALIVRRRPLAVVLVPWTVEQAVAKGSAATTPATALSTQARDVAEQLAAQAQALRRAWQPAVLVAPPPRAPADLQEAAVATGLPLVDVSEGGEVASDRAVSLIAATVSRACWPTYLAPSLRGTALDFSYAARRDTEVVAAGSSPEWLLEWLAACGYEVVGAAGADGRGSAGDAIAYRPGARRAALTLAGDLGWGAATLVRDPSAPAEVTVCLSSD